MELPSSSLRILVVDDDPATLQTLSTLLTRAGHLTTPARNGLEGLRMAESQTFDVMITDWMMPGIDGIELARRVRALRRSPLILLISSIAGPEARTHAIQAGADDFLLKPVDGQHLISVLGEWCQSAGTRAPGRMSIPPKPGV